MRKLRLSLDDLDVESFRTDDPQLAPGTVRANAAGDIGEDDAAITGWSWLCGTCEGGTCGSTCNDEHTCPPSCNDTLCNNTYCQTQTTTFEDAGA